VADLEVLFAPTAECIQLSPGSFNAHVSSARVGAVRLFAHDTNRVLEIRRHIPAQRIAIVFAGLPDGVRAASNADLDPVIRSGTEALWIDIDLPVCPPASRYELERLSYNRNLVLPAESAAALQLRSYADLVLQISTDEPVRFHSDVLRQRIENDLLVRVQRAIEAANDANAASREGKALRLIRDVEQFMWEHVDEPITLHRICDHANCRMRSLIYSFKDVFGVGPITYLKMLRLNAAHRRLREVQGTARIFDIAAALGFWHMGHFSADYKRLFGTTASETAGRKPIPRFKSRIAHRP
jgi:AraC family ethanolamine operon transcriptional activator